MTSQCVLLVFFSQVSRVELSMACTGSHVAAGEPAGWALGGRVCSFSVAPPARPSSRSSSAFAFPSFDLPITITRERKPWEQEASQREQRPQSAWFAAFSQVDASDEFLGLVITLETHERLQGFRAWRRMMFHSRDASGLPLGTRPSSGLFRRKD